MSGAADDEIATRDAEIERLRRELDALKQAARPFASPKLTTDPDDGLDGISMRGADGTYCLPDSHGFAFVWTDDPGVQITAGQIRRLRAAMAAAPEPPAATGDDHGA